MGPSNFWHVVVASRRRRRGVQAYQFCGHVVLLVSLLRLLWPVLTIMGNVRETELWELIESGYTAVVKEKELDARRAAATDAKALSTG